MRSFQRFSMQSIIVFTRNIVNLRRRCAQEKHVVKSIQKLYIKGGRTMLTIFNRKELITTMDMQRQACLLYTSPSPRD